MEYFKNWIMSIFGATVLISLACSLIPKSSNTRIIRVCGTVILVFAVFAPLKTLDPERLQTEIQIDRPGSVDAIRSENERFEITVIEERLCEYILQRSQQLGIECEVSVHVGMSENGILLPQTIELFASGNTEELERLIENECGIKPIVRGMRTA